MTNLFRAVFRDWLERPELDRDLTLSLLNFETGDRVANADLPSGLSLGLVRLAGVGAIGNAFVWSLSRLPGLKGELHLVDHECVELTNL